MQLYFFFLLAVGSHVSKRDYADAQYTNDGMGDDYGILVFSTGKITT